LPDDDSVREIRVFSFRIFIDGEAICGRFTSSALSMADGFVTTRNWNEFELPKDRNLTIAALIDYSVHKHFTRITPCVAIN